jgi:NAD(P)-dependent dehydrogenase (short-subunit alcohol dehydrogenase family)
MAGILDGKVALITGAGSGIGPATSRIFAREGAKLVLADVAEEGGNHTLKMVQELRAHAIFVKCDLEMERRRRGGRQSSCDLRAARLRLQ